MLKKMGLGLVALLVLLLVAVLVWYTQFLNRYQVDGQLEVSALEAPVKVHRDQYGIPYIFADSYPDLIRAQGFVTAQDRILQFELYRRVVSGRLAALMGESALSSDIRARVAGFYRAAQRHASILSEESRNFLQWYVEGVNAFITTRESEYPLELSLMGLDSIEPWTVTDALAIFYFGGSIHGTNIKEELLIQALRSELGEESVSKLLPVNTNPDRKIEPMKTGYEQVADTELAFSGMAPYHESAPSLLGSNNWAVAPGKSSSGHAILTSDPHLDVRQLPGFMYPVGLFAPGINAVGMSMAGMPGILIGRTDHVAFGATNAYGDSQDTYIETLDPESPDHYLEGDGASVLFNTRTEVIEVKGADGPQEQRLTVRETSRGPLISDHPVFGIKGDSLVSARWSTVQQQNPEIGVDRFLTAQNADELEQAIFDIDLVFFNFVFADSQGNIGQRASGLIPQRQWGGAAPTQVTARDNWAGFIPKDEMPGGRNPDRQWIGTANHDTRGDAYPYYYGSKFAPHYRYSRMIEVLGSSEQVTAAQSWELTLDTRNLLAVKLVPVLSSALRAQGETVVLAQQLDQWDFHDSSDAVGATVYHLVYEALVRLIFEDEFSEGLAQQFLPSRYFWQQRLDDALLQGDSPWFDDRRTSQRETLENIIQKAGVQALAQLNETLGSSPEGWQWGQGSRMVFVSPLRKSGPGRDLLGGGEYPGRGSHETLNRGGYMADAFPYTLAFMASARIVADFADDEKIMAVVPAGNVARQGHPWMTSQLSSYVDGKWLPWWRSRDKVEEHAIHTLELLP